MIILHYKKITKIRKCLSRTISRWFPSVRHIGYVRRGYIHVWHVYNPYSTNLLGTFKGYPKNVGYPLECSKNRTLGCYNALNSSHASLDIQVGFRIILRTSCTIKKHSNLSGKYFEVFTRMQKMKMINFCTIDYDQEFLLRAY